MKKYLTVSLAIAALFIVVPFVCPTRAHASVTPILTVSATGTSDNVQLNVTGDPNASVLLSYVQSGSGSQITSLGTTNASGSFSTTLSSSNYGITSGTIVHVIIGGTNGPASANVAWPAVNSLTALALSPAALVLTAGQSSTVTASNTGGNSLYLSNNSNPQIANASISGNTVTVTGNTYGTATLTLCTVGTSTNCPTVYVVVEQAGASTLTLSQGSVSLPSGQNLQVTISGGNGSYQIRNNSNPTTVGASLSGSVLTLSTSASTGSASITVCSTDMICGVVTATAANPSSVSTTFSNTNPAVAAGSSIAVNIYGLSGATFYVASNSSPQIAQANVTGSILTINGLATGTTSFSVCASTGSCGTVNATVYTGSSGNIAISQNTASLNPGQNLSITVSGGTPPYSTTGGTAAVAQQTVSGNTLTIYGIAGGTSSVQVCSAGGGCTSLIITVSGSPAATTPVVTPVTTPVTTTPAVTAPTVITAYMELGSESAQVLALQKMLVSLGYLTATPTGYYGAATKAAVIKFQKAKGLAQLGVVGPTTRAALNALASTGSSSSTINSMTLAQLQALLQSLQAQVGQVAARISQLSQQ